MRLGRQIVSVLAMYIIAINTILAAAVSPLPAGAALDPLSIICHSAQTAATGGEQAPTGQPSKACDHCSLCSVAPATFDSGSGALAGHLVPGRLLQVLRPQGDAHRDAVSHHPQQARAPPVTA